MPLKTLIAPGSSIGRNLLRSNSTYNTAHDHAQAQSVNTDNKFTLHAKSGSTYYIRRGILLYDFRSTVFPEKIKIVKAHLVLNDIQEQAPQTGGDKVRVAWVFNPNTFGSVHKNDYSAARYAAATYTSAQQVNNSTDGQIINLDNRQLLNQIQKAFNNKTWLHLAVRNELDYQDTTPTGNNRAWFDNLDDDDPPLLRIFYRTHTARSHAGRGGFGGTDIKTPKGSGFGTL
mgnify:CR=1 FL=1